MPSPTMPRIFKSTSRYSDLSRPEIGERCFFSHGYALIRGEFVEKSKTFIHEWIKQNAIVVVKRNGEHVVEVLFDGADETDLVSPEFLMRTELTEFGRAFFNENKRGMSARVKRFFIGEVA